MKTAEQILQENGINDDTFFAYGASGWDNVESAMKAYAKAACAEQRDECQRRLAKAIDVYGMKNSSKIKFMVAILNAPEPELK